MLFGILHMSSKKKTGMPILIPGCPSSTPFIMHLLRSLYSMSRGMLRVCDADFGFTDVKKIFFDLPLLRKTRMYGRGGGGGGVRGGGFGDW
jgi:hypothetical protein